MTATATIARTDPRAALDEAALHLYDAECALHAARMVALQCMMVRGFRQNGTLPI